MVVCKNVPKFYEQMSKLGEDQFNPPTPASAALTQARIGPILLGRGLTEEPRAT